MSKIIKVLNEQYPVKIKSISNKVIQNIVNDFNEILTQIDEQVENKEILLYILIIRNLTDITIPLDLDKIVAYYHVLIDEGILKEVFEKGFSANQFKQLTKKIKQFAENIDSLKFDLMGEVEHA